MAQVSKYRYLLNQYPETVQKEQFRIICHISKRTARYLLQSGLVPCVQSGKKTRNYTIKMKDIVRYLERREIHPEKYKLPPGSYMILPAAATVSTFLSRRARRGADGSAKTLPRRWKPLVIKAQLLPGAA